MFHQWKTLKKKGYAFPCACSVFWTTESFLPFSFLLVPTVSLSPGVRMFCFNLIICRTNRNKNQNYEKIYIRWLTETYFSLRFCWCLLRIKYLLKCGYLYLKYKCVLYWILYVKRQTGLSKQYYTGYNEI